MLHGRKICTPMLESPLRKKWGTVRICRLASACPFTGTLKGCGPQFLGQRERGEAPQSTQDLGRGEGAQGDSRDFSMVWLIELWGDTSRGETGFKSAQSS